MRLYHFFLIIFIASLISTICYSQPKIDSVLNSIEGLNDTTKVRILDDLAFKNRYSDQELALKCSEKALQISKTINDKSLEAKSLNIIGVLYRVFANYERSLYFFMNALKAAEEAKDSLQIGYSENNLAFAYKLKSYFNLAIEHGKAGLSIFIKLNNLAAQGYSYKTLGEIYYQQHNYTQSLRCYNNSLTIRSQLNDSSGIGMILNDIGDVYLDQKLYDTALINYSRAEKVFNQLNDQSGLLAVRGSLGAVYIALDNHDLALKYTLEALSIAESIGNITARITNMNRLGIIYAHYYNYWAGISQLEAALKLAEKYKDDYIILDCLKSYQEFFALLGDYYSAYNYGLKARDLKDSITNRESAAGVGEMEAIYQADKNWKETTLLQKNIEIAKNQRMYFYAVIGLLTAFLISLYLRIRYKTNTNKRLNELIATKDKLFSIIAHDLKNPFHSLMGISTVLKEDIADKDYEHLDDYARIIHDSSTRGYAILKNLLEWSRTQTGNMIFENKEINLFQLSDEIIEFLSPSALEKEVKINTIIDSSLSVTADPTILSTIIRNLLSNAIKYSHRGGNINLVASVQGKKTFISVADSGVGISKEHIENLFKIDRTFTTAGTNNEKGTGLGLILCKDFVKKLGGSIWVESEEGKGTKFTFTLN